MKFAVTLQYMLSNTHQHNALCSVMTPLKKGIKIKQAICHNNLFIQMALTAVSDFNKTEGKIVF